MSRYSPRSTVYFEAGTEKKNESREIPNERGSRELFRGATKIWANTMPRTVVSGSF